MLKRESHKQIGGKAWDERKKVKPICICTNIISIKWKAAPISSPPLQYHRFWFGNLLKILLLKVFWNRNQILNFFNLFAELTIKQVIKQTTDDCPPPPNALLISLNLLTFHFFGFFFGFLMTDKQKEMKLSRLIRKYLNAFQSKKLNCIIPQQEEILDFNNYTESQWYCLCHRHLTYIQCFKIFSISVSMTQWTLLKIVTEKQKYPFLSKQNPEMN